MANVDRPRGFIPVGTLSGSSWSNSLEVIQTNTTHAAIGVGDLIAATANGYVDVFTAGSTAGALGLVVGISPQGEGWNGTTGKFGDNHLSVNEPVLVGDGTRVLGANIEGTLMVCTAPDLVMVGQEDGAADPLEHADINANVNIVNAGATSNSVMMIDSSTHAATATLPLRLLGLFNSPENEYGDVSPATPWADWRVTFANHARSSSPAGV